MDESDLAHLASVYAGVVDIIEPVLEVAVSNNLIIHTIAILFLLLGIEKMEARRDEDRAAGYRYTVGQDHAVAVG